VAALAVAALAASGCTNFGDMLAGDKIDYRSGARQTTGLEVPPDLTQLARDGRFQAPGGTVSAAAAGSTVTAQPAAPSVAVSALAGMRIERAGDTRWLVVPTPPEQLWPQLRQFWLDAGFTLEIDNAKIGVIETGWAENRAKLPQDFLRRTLGRVLENLYDTGERDRFRMRVERTDSGSEVFIVHRGLVEVATDSTLKDEFRWKARPADPQLEAEFLTRLMVHLGRDEQQARAEAAASGGATPQAGARARLLTGRPTAALELDAGFDLAWRRVGLALDRSGFTVEDRDRSAGVYFVRYADKGAPEDRGFLQRLFGGESSAKADRYRIALTGDRERSVVAVQNAEGGPAPEDVGQRIAAVLVDALD
jgi:outer membrane protein assembly factor BamC